MCDTARWHFATSCAPPPSKSARWERWLDDSGALALMGATAEEYGDYVRRTPPSREAVQQIDKDVHRTENLGSHRGREALRRLLLAHAARNPRVGYTQGLNYITALLLQEQPADSDEADVFWLLCAMTELLLPEHFAPSLVGVRTDAAVLEVLVAQHASLADLPVLFESIGFDLPVVTPHWFMLAFCETLPHSLTLRVWDLLFALGSRTLVATALALLRCQADKLRRGRPDFGACYAALHQPTPSSISASELLGALMFELHFLPSKRLDQLRREHRPLAPTGAALQRSHEVRRYRYAFRFRGGPREFRHAWHDPKPRTYDAFDMIT